jgi:F-type H+-transporting ATPase subunit b
MASARDEAQRIADEGHARLNDFIARRTKSAAVKVSEVILRERMQGETAEGLVRQSLGEVRTRLQA